MSTKPSTDESAICYALLLAVVASSVRRSWHAGIIDADTAMSRLDTFLSEICGPESPASGIGNADPDLTVEEDVCVDNA